MRTITTDHAPRPAGHYSQAVVHAGLVYVAGQLPIRPDGTRVTGPVREQTIQAIANLRAILDAAGSSLDLVLRTTVYVPDVALWPEVNAAYAECFGEHRPARTVVPSRDLHHGVLVEVDAIAALRD
ncbi:MAG: RidA family protein [Phycisphaerales bacterium]|jgi:2-iminobutanoate/2-iminopropanoate deaminase|nr:RidA family protein [Phycisphaerales bacterium]